MTASRPRRAAAVIALLAAGLSACAPAPSGEQGIGYVSGDGTVREWAPQERGPAVELAGTAYDGSAVDLADYRGQVVVVTTWYAACPPCRAEAPDLVALDARPDVQVVGVNSRDDAGTAQAFERSFAVPYPSIDDADGRAIASLQGLVSLTAVPTTLVLDPEGRVAARVIGRAEPSTLTALVDGAA